MLLWKNQQILEKVDGLIMKISYFCPKYYSDELKRANKRRY